MRLIDFFIRVSLQGKAAAAELARITREAEKTKDGLNKVGAAAAKAEKKTTAAARKMTAEQRKAAAEAKKNAAAQAAIAKKSPIAKILGTIRSGGGLRVGGAGALGANVSIGPFLAALNAAPGPLKLFAGAVIAATVSLRSFARIQAAEAANVIAINPRNEDGSLRSRGEIARIRADQRRLAYDGPNLQVGGRNVLRNRSMLQNTIDIGALERANVAATAAVVASYARFSMLAEDASDDDRAKAAAIASKEAARRAGGKAGPLFEQYFNEELGKVIKLASDTHRGVSEVVRAQPKAQALIEEVGLTSSEAFALQALNASVEPTARAAAQHLNSMFVDMLAAADKKKVRDLAEKGTILFDDAGKFKGLQNFASEMLELEARGESVGGAIKSVFGEENVGPLLNFIRNIGEFQKTAKGFDTDAVLAADNAAEAQADTVSGTMDGIMASFERLMFSLGNAGFAEIFGGLATLLIFIIDAITVAVNLIGQVVKPAIEIISAIIQTLIGWISSAVKGLFSLLPKGLQNFIKTVAAPSEGLLDGPKIADKLVAQGKAKAPGKPRKIGATTKDTAPLKAPPAKAAPVKAPATKQEVQASGVAATKVAEQQAAVKETAKEITRLSQEATAQLATFKPLLIAAQKFQQAIVLYVRAARLGVKAELALMVVDAYAAAAQLKLAGAAIGASYNAGIQSGFTGATAVAGANAAGATYVDNRRVIGATPRTVERTARDVVNKQSRRQIGARNLAR